MYALGLPIQGQAVSMHSAVSEELPSISTRCSFQAIVVPMTANTSSSFFDMIVQVGNMKWSIFSVVICKWLALFAHF